MTTRRCAILSSSDVVTNCNQHLRATATGEPSGRFAFNAKTQRRKDAEKRKIGEVSHSSVFIAPWRLCVLALKFPTLPKAVPEVHPTLSHQTQLRRRLRRLRKVVLLVGIA